MKSIKNFTIMVAISMAFCQPLYAGDPLTKAAGAENLIKTHNAVALAKKLANPIAALISVPYQLNYASNIGSHLRTMETVGS